MKQQSLAMAADQGAGLERYRRPTKRDGYFAMKLHIGVDNQTGPAHSAVLTAANVHDKHPLPDLLHGVERRLRGQRLRQPEGADRPQGAPGEGLHQRAGALLGRPRSAAVP